MKYVIALKNKVSAIGILQRGHLVKDSAIIVGEREIMLNKHLGGTLEERAKILSGTIFTDTEIKHKIEEGGWI